MQDANCLPSVSASIRYSPFPRLHHTEIGVESRAHWTQLRSSLRFQITPQFAEAPDRNRLFAEFQPLVQRLIRQYGDDPELREDLVGEIYCRFCALLDAYDPTRGIPLRPYLVHQLVFSVYSFVRRHWRRHKREISLELDTITRAIPAIEDISGQWDDAMMMQKVQEGLPNAISQLSLRQRQVVIWRYYEARSFEEIAERLNVRLATARSTLRHALKNMRRKLADGNLSYE